jgi:Leucine-rich repeat (LRR) protein
MEDIRPTRRRWFQFSLRTFLVVITLVGLGCGWVGMQLEQKRRHEAAENEIVMAGGRISFSDAEKIPDWKERLLGSYAVRPVSLNLLNTDASDSIFSQSRGMNFIYLNLHSSDVTDVGLAHLKGLNGLEYLNLTHTRITDAGLTHLKGLTGLEYLNLTSTPITDAGLTHLKGLAGLEYLGLSNTQVTDAGLAHLQDLTHLERLSLENTHITDAGLIHLKGLTSLELLYLTNTQVTQAGTDELGKAIPGCRITFFSKATRSVVAAGPQP